MGRAKIAMEFISKEKARNTTYVKRKKGLIKKAHEISILCNVPVCIIIYPYKEGKLSLEAEVYSFIGDGETASNNIAIDMDRARDPMIAREIIDRYLRVPVEEKSKRALNLYDMFDDWKRRADEELCKLKHKNALAKYPSWDASFDGLNLDQLMEFLAHLDQKVEFVRRRIDMIKANSINQAKAMALEPYFEPKPISSVMIPSDTTAHHHMGYPEFGGYNHFPLLNYPINNNNNNNSNLQEYCHQIVPFNHNVYPDQVCAPRIDDHGASSSNLVMYDMNMMDGMGPTYYDQGLGTVDSAGATTSYGAGLPMSMPLQLPMLPNVSLPMQRQYQMFYK